jgi:hypothetical protein
MALSKLAKGDIKSLLEKSESTVTNTGQWTGAYKSVSFWIGDKSGSRTNNYDAAIKIVGLVTEVRAKTYSALIKKIIQVLNTSDRYPIG